MIEDRDKIEKRLFIKELEQMTADNLEEVYQVNAQKYGYYKSSSAEVEGQSIKKGWERFLTSIDDRNMGKAAILDAKTTNGFEIYEPDFLEYEIPRVERLLNAHINDLQLELKKAGRAYLELLKSKQFAPLEINDRTTTERVRLVIKSIPPILQTPEAKQYFIKASEAGLIANDRGGYSWQGTKQLLAYFAEKMSDQLKLSTKIDQNGNLTISWKPFESAFGVENLRSAKAERLRLHTTFHPTGYETVDAIFK